VKGNYWDKVRKHDELRKIQKNCEHVNRLLKSCSWYYYSPFSAHIHLLHHLYIDDGDNEKRNVICLCGIRWLDFDLSFDRV